MRWPRRTRRPTENIGANAAMTPARDFEAPMREPVVPERVLDQANAEVARLQSELAKAEVRGKYLTLGDLDRALKYAGLDDGLSGVHSLGLDGPRGDMGGALEVIVHRYTNDAYGRRSWRQEEHPGATLGDGVGAETRRFLLRRDGGLDPR